MSTKSPRSPGSQFTGKGVVQGTALTSPKDGLPVDVVIDGNGLHRLAVNADVSVSEVIVNTRDLDCHTDNVAICDPNSNSTLKIESDGSVNANIHTSAFAATPDSELIVGSEDGTTTGTKHVVKVNPDGSLAVSIISGTEKNTFNEITAIAISATVNLVTYTVPVSKIAYLQRISVSGSNIAIYNITINGTPFDKIRTYFGSSLKQTEGYSDSSNLGFKLNTGDTVLVTVNNFRPSLGDFEGRIQVIEV